MCCRSCTLAGLVPTAALTTAVATILPNFRNIRKLPTFTRPCMLAYIYPYITWHPQSSHDSRNIPGEKRSAARDRPARLVPSHLRASELGSPHFIFTLFPLPPLGAVCGAHLASKASGKTRSSRCWAIGKCSAGSVSLGWTVWRGVLKMGMAAAEVWLDLLGLEEDGSKDEVRQVGVCQYCAVGSVRQWETGEWHV